MNTFLPYPSFSQSAQVLDRQRLGKQRVEAKQIYQAICDPSYGWQNHPVVRMWRNHKGTLAFYGWTICQEWISRGYKDTLMSWFAIRMPACTMWQLDDIPLWLGREDFHLSHRSNLLRKNAGHYRQFFLDIPDNLPYIWPA